MFCVQSGLFKSAHFPFGSITSMCPQESAEDHYLGLTFVEGEYLKVSIH